MAKGNGTDKRKGNYRGGVGKSLWKWEYILRTYRMVRVGMTLVEVCRDIGVTKRGFDLWRREYPALQEAIVIAQRERAEAEQLPGWVYARLSPELRMLWDEIGRLEGEDSGLEKIEVLLSDQGRVVRQQLFLHALCMLNFSQSAAMHKVNISKRDLDSWIRSDPDFAELVVEMQFHKAEFFEHQLVQLVREGNPAAVLFANKTFNRERGYSVRSEVDVNVSGAVLHGVLDLSEIMGELSEGAKMEVLSAIEKRNREDRPELTVQKPSSAEEVIRQRIQEMRTEE
jgi:hypothetical protein